MPFYFSGTDCRASGEAVCPGLIGGEANWMVTAWLSLDGQNLKYWQKPPGEPGSTAVGLDLVFDSTHFPPSSNVEVRFKAKDSHGNFYEATGVSVVKNRACLYNYPEFLEIYGGDSSTLAYNMLSGKNYDRKLMNDSWPNSVLSAELHNPGIWIVHTHANNNWHYCSPGSSSVYHGIPATGTPNYGEARDYHNGDWFPPFNSTANPPVHLAIMQGCNTGPPIQYVAILLPYFTEYNQTEIVNQAVVSFAGTIYTNDSERLISWFLGPLLDGSTVGQARFEFFEMNKAERDAGRPTVRINGTPWDSIIDLADEMPIGGDALTRVKTVYRPLGVVRMPPNEWWL